MGSLDGVPVKILTGYGGNSMNRTLTTPPHHLISTLSPVLRNPRKKTLNRRKQGLLGMSYPRNIRLIRKSSFTQGVSDVSDEHQLPIILWVRIEGLNELGNRTTHQVGFVDSIGVTDGGHLFLEDDG